jgi:hypothetical protein
MKKQVIAVVDEVKEVLGDAYDVSIPSAGRLTKENIADIQNAIFNGLVAGEIECKKDVGDTKALKTYANGLVSNHLRKCKLLNGNVKYVASGTGPKRDERLRELNKILASGDYVEGSEQYVAIQEAITTRKSELSAAKSAAKSVVKASEIDTSVLSPEMQGMVNNAVNPED